MDTGNAGHSGHEFGHPMNLGNIDLNLLKVLDVLLVEGSVTRAGKRLGRSQPAVSSALQRLQHLLGDELLVRGPEGFVLTARAEAIRGPLREALGLVESCVSTKPRFDPAKATAGRRGGSWHIGRPHIIREGVAGFIQTDFGIGKGVADSIDRFGQL